MENKEQPARPQPIFQCRITAMSNGSVSVAGFPPNLNTAMDVMSAATRAITAHFIAEAKAGTLDNDNTIMPPKIISQDKNLVGMDGKPLQ